MALEFKHPNPYIIFRKMKQLMKDVELGSVDRDEATILFMGLAAELSEKKPVYEQISLDELDTVAERVRNHLRSRSDHPSNVRSINSWKAK